MPNQARHPLAPPASSEVSSAKVWAERGWGDLHSIMGINVSDSLAVWGERESKKREGDSGFERSGSCVGWGYFLETETRLVSGHGHSSLWRSFTGRKSGGRRGYALKAGSQHGVVHARWRDGLNEPLRKGLHRMFFAFGFCGNARTLSRFIPSQSLVWVVDLREPRRRMHGP